MKNRLRELRALNGTSQQALADQVGVSRQTINSLEVGRYNPSLELAVRIARTFTLPVEEVFVVDDHQPATTR